MAAADLVIEEDAGHVERVGVRYRPDYLNLAGAISLDPIALPLSGREYVFTCRGGVPAILDDYLPDNWGRRVLSYAVLKATGQHLNARSAIACLGALSRSRIGAIEITEPDDLPQFELGITWSALAQAEEIASQIDTLAFEDIPAEALDLIYLANEGSGAGGARPKTLLNRDGAAYLAKFNRRHADQFNYARVELACLQMARAAGIHVFDGEVVPVIADREVLLLERFDVVNEHRAHLITINGLRKDRYQRDETSVFLYEFISEILKRHSADYLTDAQQLLRVMLFNRAIHNTDDHERNFSLINDGSGYRLSPAYDMVPSLSRGEYHAAGFGTSPNPPLPSEAPRFGKIFGLSTTAVKRACDDVIAAIERWSDFAEANGVNDVDTQAVRSVIRR